MYKDNSQLRMEDFIFPYGKLDPENDWVKLAALVPWEIAEERYAARFVNNGHPAHPARMALGALLIQRRLKCSDQWLVKHIGENPYLQYFIGMKECQRQFEIVRKRRRNFVVFRRQGGATKSSVSLVK